jgi:hypothetical protein
MHLSVLSISVLLTSSLLSASSLALQPSSSSLVVYNSDIGLVHETRELLLDKGKQSLVYPDVASSVQTDSVNVMFPNGVTLYSQQYRFDQIDASKLAQAHLGREVKFYLQTGSDLLFKSGTLLSADPQAVVKTAQDEIFTIPVSALIFSEIPKELITKPSLVWNIDAPHKSTTTLSLDYLINSISWKSDYILNLSKDSADLSGWITINNRSGKAFKETKLSVLAGDINRVKAVDNRIYMAKALLSEAETAVVESSREGYHLYQIPFAVTLANNEKTQIKFLDIKKIPIERKYDVQLNNPFYTQGEIKHSVNQYLEIKSLDNPLPMGTIRSYSKEQETTLLLGESRIEHTPQHEKIKVALGMNFDLLVNEKLISTNSDRYYLDTKVSYELVNRSKEPKMVQLLIPFEKREDAQSIVDSSEKYYWKSGNLLAFDLLIKADSKKIFDVHYRNKN